MFRRISRQERERRAARAELETTLQALRSNERAFTEAQDPFYIGPVCSQLCVPSPYCAVPPASGTECAVCWQGPSAVWAHWLCWACWSR